MDVSSRALGDDNTHQHSVPSPVFHIMIVDGMMQPVPIHVIYKQSMGDRIGLILQINSILHPGECDLDGYICVLLDGTSSRAFHYLKNCK